MAPDALLRSAAVAMVEKGGEKGKEELIQELERLIEEYRAEETEEAE